MKSAVCDFGFFGKSPKMLSEKMFFWFGTNVAGCELLRVEIMGFPRGAGVARGPRGEPGCVGGL